METALPLAAFNTATGGRGKRGAEREKEYRKTDAGGERKRKLAKHCNRKQEIERQEERQTIARNVLKMYKVKKERQNT